MISGRTRTWLRRLAAVAIPFSLLFAAGRMQLGGRPSGPFVPDREDEPLERLPLAARDPEALKLRSLERAVQVNPNELGPRVALAKQCVALYRSESDPRYLGRAEAALGAWFDEPSPPSDVRLLRALVRQSNHDFAAALTDLDVLVQATPGDPEPWLVRAVVRGVLGRYAESLTDCGQAHALAGSLVGAVCRATPLAMTGHAEEARRGLLSALGAGRRPERAERAQRVWALSTLAEVEQRLGLNAETASRFESALALEPRDPYTLAAYADFLLDHGDPRRVVELLSGFERIDALLLRLAIAEKQSGSAEHAKDRAAELAARFDAARLRGDVSHRREESRFALALAGDPARALALAQANWAVQRETGDARVLLEAAAAARDRRAAAPVLAFLAKNGSSDPTLLELVRRVEALQS